MKVCQLIHSHGTSGVPEGSHRVIVAAGQVVQHAQRNLHICILGRLHTVSEVTDCPDI